MMHNSENFFESDPGLLKQVVAFVNPLKTIILLAPNENGKLFLPSDRAFNKIFDSVHCLTGLSKSLLAMIIGQ